MKRVLFIDRDGTLIVEPPSDKQVDSLEKLEFVPGVFAALSAIQRTLPYEFVMVTNQDGLGSSSFPEETFWPAHNKMIKMLEAEGILFSDILIDRSRPEDNVETRKPGTGMLGAYLSGAYDLENSYVIGDRESDVELAQNLGAKSVLFGEGEATLSTNSWNEIYRFLRKQERCSRVVRETAETKIEVSLALDGSGESDITTGLGFFDHMLEQIAKHAGCNLRIVVEGDLHVDEHHTIEDTAIALGEAVANCLENKQGIARYGFLLPMDDCLAQVALDFCSRPAFVWDAVFSREKVGEMPTEMFSHFFKSFSDAARCNLQISAQGENEHHKIEAIFKGFARSLRQAWYLDYAEQVLPSTKGSL